MLPEQVKKFTETFSRLPSLGPRMAVRLAFYLINLDRQGFKNLANAFLGLKNINHCPRCFFIKDVSKKLCEICSNPKRDKTTIAIVEKETDLLSLEKTGEFKGVYLVIGETSGRGILEKSQKLKLNLLKKLAERDLKGKFKEIIIAVNPTTRGDLLAGVIRKEMENYAEKITRLGRGIPTGGEIEFADEETLSSALKRRN